MAFKLVVTELAASDIDEAATYIAGNSPVAAARCLTDLWDIVYSLDEMPERHALIPEAEHLGMVYRSALHHSHRIIFRVDEESATVFIVRIYHGARKPLSIADF